MTAHARRRLDSDGAEVGVGTLIVFIAMVLVAAVAASVLIGTSGNLQQRAMATGMEATAEVSSNLQVQSVDGARASTADLDLHDIKIQVQLAAGSVPVDLSTLIIRMSDGQAVKTYNYSSAALADNAPYVSTFAAVWIRGDGDGAVAKSGDLVELHFNLETDLLPRKAVQVTMIPETGSPAQGDFRTPPSYGDDLIVSLR